MVSLRFCEIRRLYEYLATSSVVHLLFAVVALCLVVGAFAPELQAQTFPQYDHVFLITMENEGYDGIIGNQYAPILNAIAKDYGLATNYSGVGDPSEPKLRSHARGDTFGISSDDPYWFPGQTVSASNLMSELTGAGKTWRGYFQNMPYPGYREYCCPTSATVFPMPTRSTSPSTMAL
jgi:hypothetical protein